MDTRGGAEHAEAFYDTWDFARKAVELYAAGVSWKGMTIYGQSEGSTTSDVLGEVNEDTLREAVPSWVVTGTTHLTVATDPELTVRYGRGSDSETLTIRTPPQGRDRAPGYTLLWPACTNHEAIVEMRDRLAHPTAQQLLALLLRFAYQGLALPSWALDATQARSATADMVTMGLHFYRLRVDQWREAIRHDLSRQLRNKVADTDSKWTDIHLSWNEEWSPSNSYEGWDALYEAFASCGIVLKRFATEYVSTLRQVVDGRLFPGSVLAGWERLGF